jgi:hypothetical protein
VSLRVVEEATCDVAVVVEKRVATTVKLERVLLIFFGGPHDRHALEWAVKMVENQNYFHLVVLKIERSQNEEHDRNNELLKMCFKSTFIEFKIKFGTKLTDILKDELDANEYSLIIVGYDGRVVKKILSKCDIPVMAVHSYEIKQILRDQEQTKDSFLGEEGMKRHEIHIPMSSLLASSETGSHSRQPSRRSSFGPDPEPIHRTGTITPPVASSRDSSSASTPRIGPSPEHHQTPRSRRSSFQYQSPRTGRLSIENDAEEKQIEIRTIRHIISLSKDITADDLLERPHSHRPKDKRKHKKHKRTKSEHHRDHRSDSDQQSDEQNVSDENSNVEKEKSPKQHERHKETTENEFDEILVSDAEDDDNEDEESSLPSEKSKSPAQRKDKHKSEDKKIQSDESSPPSEKSKSESGQKGKHKSEDNKKIQSDESHDEDRTSKSEHSEGQGNNDFAEKTPNETGDTKNNDNNHN